MTWTRVTCSLPHHFDIMVTLKVYKQIVMMLKVHSVIPHYLSALEACCLVHYIVSISYGTVLPQKNWRKLKWEAESLNSLWFPAQVCGSEPHEAVRLTSSSPKQQALKIWCHSCVKMRGNAVWESAHFSSDTGSDASSVRRLTCKHITTADRHRAQHINQSQSIIWTSKRIFSRKMCCLKLYAHILDPSQGLQPGLPATRRPNTSQQEEVWLVKY